MMSTQTFSKYVKNIRILKVLNSYRRESENNCLFCFYDFIIKFFKTNVILQLWIFIFIIPKIVSSSSNSYRMQNMSTRVVLTKQAQFQGFFGPGNIRKNTIYQSDPYSYRSYGHPVVEIFKGIPYANPPLDSLRYESPSPYPYKSTEVYIANVIKTPCPRFGNETKEMLSTYQSTKDSIRSINKIKNLEDCLYLDIYIPMNLKKDTDQGLPVLVFANSESDDDNNPFDGSSMAAIGNLIVISFRYRVGVLGFLQPGYSDEVRSNFGLWDQLAALQWVRENIKYFGGDENNVCLMASDLDAALAGVLAFSRMSQAYGGLFHRLILLNSSPFSPTSLHSKPFITTVHIARALNCPVYEKDGELLACLRSKPVTRLLSAAQTIGIEDLEYPFIPGLDGTIVHHDLSSLGFGGNSLTNSVQELLGRFDLLCGLSEGAVLPNLGRFMWQNIELERFVIAAIKLYLKLEPGIKPSGNLRQDVIRAIQNVYGERPLMRELISDFLVINPMIQLLEAHFETGKNTFFYVSKDYDPLHKGKHNELSYIFTSQIYQWKYIDLGKPNLDLQPFDVFISLIANFVRSGDPNISPGERASIQVKPWPKYKKSQGRYLNFGREVDLRSKYRHEQTDFWSQEFPTILKPFMKHNMNENNNHQNEHNNWQIKNTNNIPPFFGGGSGRGKNFYPNMTHIYPAGDSPGSTLTTSTMTDSTVILIGCLLVLLNLLCFLGLFHQRKRLRKARLQLRERFLKNEEQEEHQQQRFDTEQTLTELDSQESGPYMARDTIQFPHQHNNVPLSLDAMSEAETENGFSSNFLGPNYDVRTKVNRWMFQHNQNQDSFDSSRTPIPTTPVPSSMPMHIDIRSYQRSPESSNFLTMAPTIQEFIPMVPYETSFQSNIACSDIPYADSRVTSPSASNFCEVQTPPPSFNNNLSNINLNNNQQKIPSNIQQQSPSSITEFKKRNAPNRSSIIIPLRNSIIIQDSDGSVESSAPKLVPVKTGILTRSVGVGSNDTPSISELENNEDQICNCGENVPSNFDIPTSSTKHPHSHSTQKVTFADGF